jgi:dihydropyrimidinase
MGYDLVIKGGRLVTAETTFIADVAIHGEQIQAIGNELRGEREMDATGLYVLPGAIDGHVHLTDEHSASVRTADSFVTGSRAAAFGGVTTLIDFAESQPGLSLVEALQQRQEDADGRAAIDYSLHLNLRDPDPARLAEIPAVFQQGVPSFKFFMAWEAYRLPDVPLFRAMEAVAAHNGLAVIHAENDDLIQEFRQRFAAKGLTGPRWHTAVCPPLTESEAIHRVLAFAGLAHARVLIYHVSSEEGVQEIARAKQRGQSVFGEACVQYLIYTDEVYQADDWTAEPMMVRPPIRDAAHQQALWQGLAEGSLDIISTDHNPRERRPTGQQQPPGMAGIEARLALMHTFGVRRGHLSLERWVERCCTRPAHVFGLSHKGRLAPGYDADIVLFDPTKEVAFSTESLHSAVDYCSYEGITVTGFPVATISRGRVLVENGEFVGTGSHGRFMARSY